MRQRHDLRTGRNGSLGKTYRYYACSTKARQGPFGCKGMTLPMDRLDEAVIDFLLSDLLDSARLEELMAPLLCPAGCLGGSPEGAC